MRRHPAVIIAFVLACVGLLSLLAAVAIDRLTHPGEPDPGTNGVGPWFAAVIIGVMLITSAGIFGLVGLLASRRQGARADAVGCGLLFTAVVLFWVGFTVLGELSSSPPAEANTALALLCGLLLVASLIILAARPDARGPQEVDHA